MNQKMIKKEQPQSHFLWGTAIIIIGFNLRPAITSVGPLLGTIKDEIGLSNWKAGLVTSLPLIAFAITSGFSSKLSQRFGNLITIAFGLIFLLIGIIIRSISFIPMLFIGTILIGVGIAVMNVLLPAVIKERYPHKTGSMTSIYTTSMKLFAALASGIAVPLAKGAGLGWQLSLGVWAITALIGLIIWGFIVNREQYTIEYRNKASIASDKSLNESKSNIWMSPLAWQVTVFMGTQSFIFYTIISWIPTILIDLNFSISMSGWLLSYMQFISLPTAFLAPILAERFNNQIGIVLAIGVLIIIGFIGLLIGGSHLLIIFWITIIGASSGATISLSLAIIGLRSRNANHASKLSGMAQAVGYILAAVGPLLIGLLYDLLGTWEGPIIAIIIVCMIMIISGMGAGRNEYVLNN